MDFKELLNPENASRFPFALMAKDVYEKTNKFDLLKIAFVAGVIYAGYLNINERYALIQNELSGMREDVRKISVLSDRIDRLEKRQQTIDEHLLDLSWDTIQSRLTREPKNSKSRY